MWYDGNKLGGQDWLSDAKLLEGSDRDKNFEQRKWLTRREYSNQWVGDLIGFGDEKQDK